MRLEEQVCSLELAKHLKTLGVRQESAFYWYNDHHGNIQPDLFNARIIGSECLYVASAFTVAELGVLIKEHLDDSIIQDLFFENKNPTLIRDGIVVFTAETEANCRAKMLIHLIGKGIVKP